MTKTKELDRLFERWENAVPEYNGLFVKDGIIDESSWDEAGNPKILYITKEPNHRDEPEPGDFRQDWMEGIYKYHFAYRIAEWTFGIYNQFKKPFNELHNDNDPDKYGMYLRKVALMNIKKSGGGPLASDTEITEVYKRDRTFIIEQIRVIDPSLIILCLSWNDAISEGLFENASWQNTGYNLFMGAWQGVKIIDFYHPSSRTAPAASFSLLKDIYLSPAFQTLN